MQVRGKMGRIQELKNRKGQEQREEALEGERKKKKRPLSLSHSDPQQLFAPPLTPLTIILPLHPPHFSNPFHSTRTSGALLGARSHSC